ncbi:MAG TPA: ribosome biogenesis factor YjgA [Pseudoxanthomonas sp.]|nr:ribosome biogenesis factor YjgA [Pseudoxanthomonas sp.]
MRGIDPETGQFLGPSRTRQRREALEVRGLGERLVALPPAQLARLPIPETLLEHIHETQRITSHIAHKRQLQFLAKQMRRESDRTLEAIRDAMDVGGESARRETAILHRVEQWRARLLEGGDVALNELLADHPGADRRHLRQLVRNAGEERLKNKPPHAYRELFRELRELLAEADDGAVDESAEDI